MIFIVSHTLQEHQRNRTNATVSRDSNIEKYENSIVVNGSIHIFNHAAYVSQDYLKIYIWKNVIRYGDPTYVETFMDPIRMIHIINIFYQVPILSPT